jgi:hypothetical protein
MPRPLVPLPQRAASGSATVERRVKALEIRADANLPAQTGVISPSYASGDPMVTVGSDAAETGPYQRLSSYTPVASDTVALLRAGGTGIVLGRLELAAAFPGRPGRGDPTVRGGMSGTAETAAQASTAASTSSVGLFPVVFPVEGGANGRAVYNDSTATLYLLFGAGASVTNYTVQISPGGYYEFPQPLYCGEVDGVWSAATGYARTTAW